jgi:4-carboxymuconolactone decarboxylase
VIQHAAIYAGLPAANHAFKVAAPILAEIRGGSLA